MLWTAKLFVRLAKASLWFLFVVATMVAMLACFAGATYCIDYLTELGLWPKQQLIMVQFAIEFFFPVVGGMVLGLCVVDKIDHASSRLDRWMEQVALRRVPTIYTCYNNGVLAVVRKEDYDASTYGGRPLIVPGALTFSDSKKNTRVSVMVTGTMEDFHRLTRGANVVKLMPIGMYVPYSSGMMRQDAEDKLFPHVPLGEAEMRIWQGHKRPKHVRAA